MVNHTCSPSHFVISVTSFLFNAFFLYFYAAIRDLHSFPTRRSSDLPCPSRLERWQSCGRRLHLLPRVITGADQRPGFDMPEADRKSTRLNSSHTVISYAVFCLKKKKQV